MTDNLKDTLVLVIPSLAAVIFFVTCGARLAKRAPWIHLGAYFTAALFLGFLSWVFNEYKPTGTDYLSFVTGSCLIATLWLFLLTLLFAVIPKVRKDPKRKVEP
jgi:arginine exporter protein ArgO